LKRHSGSVLAIRQREFGPPEVLVAEEVADPEPGRATFASPSGQRAST